MERDGSNKVVSSADPQQIAVIGAGYVGLPTAVTLASFGHHVTLAEINEARFSALSEGRSPILEPGLEELLRSELANGRLRVVRTGAEAVAGARFVFLCVPTPLSDNGAADLTYVFASANEIAPVLENGAIVVDKSTVPVGTAHELERRLGRSDVAVVSNPEFLREGSAVADSLAPERVVVGADDPAAARAVADLFATTKAPVLITSTETAETIKYASNAFLAVKLSFINAMSEFCERSGADIRELALALGMDSRIGDKFLQVGPGWGGSCLPKDTAALLSMSNDLDFDFELLRGAIRTNELQLQRVVRKVTHDLDPATARVAVWGLTFKAGTDDRRSSPAVDVARRLVEFGANVVAYDPTVASNEPHDDLAGLTVAADPYEAARGARVVVVLTEWPEFANVDLDRLASVAPYARVVDARNVLDPTAVRARNFDYDGMGSR